MGHTANPGNFRLKLPQAWVQLVPQPIAKEVHRKDDEQYGKAWEEGYPPRGGYVVASLSNHIAPRGRGRRNTDAKEAKDGFRDN